MKPEATSSPLFAVNVEEPAEDGEVGEVGEVEPADRPGRQPVLQHKQMSMASVKFDVGNKGFLTKDEEAARGMANKAGDVDHGAIVRLIAQNRDMKKCQRWLASLSLFLLVTLVGTGAILFARLDRATASTQAKISEAATTEIAQDEGGLPHLVDRASGGELTVRAEGDTFDTREVFDPVTSRRLHCLPVHEAARMVSDLSHGVAGSVVEHDAAGASKKIVSIAGDFEDHGRYLEFGGGSFRIVLDDDGCNRGADLPPDAVDVDPEGTVDAGPALEAAAAPAHEKRVPAAPAPEDADVDPGPVDAGPEAAAAAVEGAGGGDGNGDATRAAPRPTDANPFARRLRLHAETPEQRAAVLHKQRRAYEEAGTAIREGRQLFGLADFLGAIVPGQIKQLETVVEMCDDIANNSEGAKTSCSKEWTKMTGCTYEPYKNDMNWGDASIKFRQASSDTCLERLKKGLGDCMNLAVGKCAIPLDGDCGLEAEYVFPTMRMDQQRFYDPTDLNIHRPELIVSATVDAEVRASFDFNLDIQIDPTYKEQQLKVKFTAGYTLNSKFKLTLIMPPSSTGTNHMGTFEVAQPLTKVPANVFRRLFMVGPVPLLVEVEVQPMIWLDVIFGADAATLEFDINSSVDAEFEVLFDIDQLKFETKDKMSGNPFTLENVKLSGEFSGTLSARAGARYSVSINGQPVHLDAALALKLVLEMQPDVDNWQRPCLRGSLGFTSGLEWRASTESPFNIAGKIKTGCTTAASLATPLLGLMNSNMITSCAADKIGWTETSLTDLCDEMYEGIMSAEAFQDKCGAGMLFEDIPISAWVTIIGFETTPLESLPNLCPTGVTECPTPSAKAEAIGPTGIMADIDQCMREKLEAQLPGLVIPPSFTETTTCCPKPNKKECDTCPCAPGLKCIDQFGKKVCTDGDINSPCYHNSHCSSTSHFCSFESGGTCQAKYSLGSDCQPYQHDECLSNYCNRATMKCMTQGELGAACGSHEFCNTDHCVCDEDIPRLEECMTVTVWLDRNPWEISFKIVDACSIFPRTVFSHDFATAEAASLPDSTCVDNGDCPSRFKYCAPAGFFVFSISDWYGDGMWSPHHGYGRWEVQYQGVVHEGNGDFGAGTSVHIGNRDPNCLCTKRCGRRFINQYYFGDAGDNCGTDTDCNTSNRCMRTLEKGLYGGDYLSKCYAPVPVRSVKISLPGVHKYLSLSEVQVFATYNEVSYNIARSMDSKTTQSSRYSSHAVAGTVDPPELSRSYSSVWADDAIGTGHARSMIDSPQGWSAKYSVAGQWMQIDLGSVRQVSGVITQPRGDYPQWVKTFTVKFSTDGKSFEDVPGTFTSDGGNNYIKTTSNFPAPVIARYIRLVVQTWHGHISMRAAPVVHKTEMVDLPELSRSYSSVWADDAIGTGYARSMIDSPQGWSAKNIAAGQWMQMDLGLVCQVSGVITQPRGDYPQWVKTFTVDFSTDGKSFKTVPVTYSSAGGVNIKTTSNFPEPVIARYIRLVVQTWYGHISMRATPVVFKTEISEVGLYGSEKAVNGLTVGDNFDITSTQEESNPWWMVTFGRSHIINRVVVWNRQDCCPERLEGASLLLLDDNAVVIKSYPLVVLDGHQIVFDNTW